MTPPNRRPPRQGTSSALLLSALASVLLTACSSTQPRDNGVEKAKAAESIRRICALPEPERQAEIDKIKAETGLTLLCSK